LTLCAGIVGLAALCIAPAADAAPGDLPDLAQSRPGSVTGGYFDDHSISGDNHLAWSTAPSQSEPLAIDFTSSITNNGAGALEVCGYPSGTPGWMTAFQIAPGVLGNDCPPTAPATGQRGWFRAIVANHSTPGDYNRWHLMDLQRFALVPLPPSIGGPAGAATAWDTYWGTCMNLGDPSLYCTSAGVNPPFTGVGIAAGQGKVTQDGAPDDQRIAIPADARASFPDGAYQIVAISNPYGAYSEQGRTNGSVACTNVTLAGAPAYAGFTATPGAAVPDTCYVPRTIAAPLTGPGGRDPMASAYPTTPACTLMAASGHCWAVAPTSGAYTPAQSNVNATIAQTVVPTDAVPVPQGADYRVTPVAAPPPAPQARRYFTSRNARARVRTALRRQFGRRLQRLRVSCRVTASTRATCTVRWRTSGATYRGRVDLRVRTVRNRLRWQYRVNVVKRKDGRAQRIRRNYRSGGIA
jgi:hypothetical protein